MNAVNAMSFDYTGTRVLVFDGVFVLVGVAMTWAALQVFHGLGLSPELVQRHTCFEV